MGRLISTEQRIENRQQGAESWKQGTMDKAERRKRQHYGRRLVRFAGRWGVPVVLSGLIIMGYHTISASPEPTADELVSYLESNPLNVGSETVGGYQQIYYAIDERRVFITDEPQNSRQPAASNEYVVWVQDVDGNSQIMLHNVLTKATLIISGDSTNQNPVIDGDRIAWEKWVNESWQIFYYDGTAIRQLSQNHVSVRPVIEGEEVAYAQKLSQDNTSWRVVRHNLTSNTQEVVLTDDESNAWPHFIDGVLETKYNPFLP